MDPPRRPKIKRKIGGASLTVTVQPPRPAFPEDPQASFSQHLNECRKCREANAENAPLCIDGAKLHRALKALERRDAVDGEEA